MSSACLVTSLVLLACSSGVLGQLNPLGRFGKCVDVPVDILHPLPENKVWYLQYRTDNPDHYVHTCQAQYEKTIKNDYTSLLYYYNKGKMVHNPQPIKYTKVSEGIYYRGITVDDEPVYVYMKVLKYDPDEEYRVVYYCTDHAKANPKIFNVNVGTLSQNPLNLAEVHDESVAEIKSASKWKVNAALPLMRVDQSPLHCEPLNVNVN